MAERGAGAASSRSPAKRFRAVLKKERGGMGWTIARVPFEPGEVWAEMIRLRVRGEVNGTGFRSSLFSDGSGYYLMLNKDTQRRAHVALGDTVEIAIEPDLEPRPAELPDELAALLDDEAGLRAWYEALSESMRREIGKWVLGVKSEDARMRRAQQMAERLLGAMEAERELPPAIVRAFRARPKAKLGWERMTVVQRRQQLLGVFYYQTPEARERRIQKLLEDAERRASERI